jgi:uncharacterized membrane protein
MKIRYVLLIILIIALAILLVPVENMQKIFTSKVISEENSKYESEILDNYTYTKAICNSTNFCQDYEIICNGKNILKSTPITGAFIQHDETWIDPREKNSNTNLCG